jgi:hypothetical protein
MSDTETPTRSPGFHKMGGKRTFTKFVIFAIVGACYWFMLTGIQALIIPNAPGGPNGPWVVRPILAYHFCAMAVMTAVTVPFIIRPLQRVWTHEDAALGAQHDPIHGRPRMRVLFFVKGFLLLAVYAAGLVFYLFSWTIIGPEGIEEKLPWTTLKHSFRDIGSLETIPDGQRSESLRQDGPWYCINLKSGRSIDLSDGNEGCTRDELSAMTTFIADRSGLAWRRRSDARAH